MSAPVDAQDTGPGTAVVTGGGTGIGLAIARRLASRGNRVVIAGRRSEVLARAGGELIPCTADLSRPADVEALAEFARAELGTVGALVLNAGGAQHGPAETLTELAEHWRSTVDQNILSAVLPAHAFQPLLRRPGGRVVVVTSAAARAPGGGGEVAYASTKAALNRWIRTLATELGPDGITANAVAPGFVPDTGLYGPSGADPAWSERIGRGIAVGRTGTGEDIAAAVEYLVSPAAGFTNGTVLEVDGGVRTR